MHRPPTWQWQLFVLVAVTGCRGAAPLPARAVELNQAGIEALQAGDLDTAATRFELALEYSPRFVEALANQGLVELERGNFGRARQLLERARRLNPDVAQPHHGLGVLEEREGRPDRAAEQYRAALAVDPGFVAARANLGRLLFLAGNLEHARAEFARALAADPKDLASLVGSIECLLRLDRSAEADATLESAVAAHPTAPEITLLLARRDLREDRPEAALGLLAPLARRHDDFGVAALGWMGVAELLRGRPREAIGAGRAALALAPEDALATWVVAAGLGALDGEQAAAWKARSRAVAPP